LTGVTVTGGTTPSLASGLLNFLDPIAPAQGYFVYGEILPQVASLGELILCDLLAYYPGISGANAALQPLVGAASVLPARLASGLGVHLLIDVTTTLGAGAATVVVGYTNRNGTAGQLTQTTTMIPSSVVGRVPTSRFLMPLQAGDDGVQSAQSFDLSASMAGGVMSLALIKPLVSIPIGTLGTPGTRSWLVDPIDVTRILTGAALTAIFIPSAAFANLPLLGNLKNVKVNPN
jgi:hypothetical protein